MRVTIIFCSRSGFHAVKGALVCGTEVWSPGPVCAWKFSCAVIYGLPGSANSGFLFLDGGYLINQPDLCPSALVLVDIDFLILASAQGILLGKGKCQKCKATLIKLAEIRFPCWLPAIENPFVSFLKFPVTKRALFISFYQIEQV